MKAKIYKDGSRRRFKLWCMDVLILTIDSETEDELLATLDAINLAMNQAVYELDLMPNEPTRTGISTPLR